MTFIEEKFDITITENFNIRDALKQMDRVAEGILFVIDSNKKLIGTLTDGDIRRGLLNSAKLTDCISNIYNKKPFSMSFTEFDKDLAIKTLSIKRFKAIPIIDDAGILIAYQKSESIIKGGEKRYRKLDIPVIIMAGGKGTRMAPFTNVLPKPLIPIGEKTILELIIEEFKQFGIEEYYFTINYKGEMIKAYFNCIEHDYKITYLKETEFYGTAGSLKLLPKDFNNTFIVSNCDIIVKADFSDIIDFHKKSKAILTIVSSIQNHRIPYGVIKFKNGGIVSNLEEKPELSFCVNTGVYVLESECLDYIPSNNIFHMTNLIETLINAGKCVVTYPVSEKEYFDIGQWDEYRQVLKIMEV